MYNDQYPLKKCIVNLVTKPGD